MSSLLNNPPLVTRFRRGYSFPEVMFAVVVLGIGFIMIAAIFPVALKQSKLTVDENRGTSIARSAVDYLKPIAHDKDVVTGLDVTAPAAAIMPPTGALFNGEYPGWVLPFATVNGWNQLKGRLILKDDPRYAWVPLYRRDGNPGAPIAQWKKSMQVILIPVLCYNRTNFSELDVADPLNAAPIGGQPTQSSSANLFPRYVRITLDDGDSKPTPGPDTITFHNLPGSTPATVAEGTYVVRCFNDNQPNSVFIYKVGTRRTDLGADTWELQPGNDIQNAAIENITSPADPNNWALVVGREWDPTKNAFIGPAQDIGIYTTFIPIK